MGHSQRRVVRTAHVQPGQRGTTAATPETPVAAAGHSLGPHFRQPGRRGDLLATRGMAASDVYGDK